ncbi:unnamed protein product [Linum tenue]|uniref:F-box domain-containing protein n=1 Tax=Linum tenue TaxID=586396 RepID=A0AAV0R259_9ROSI|nr:unnamed protein product [Linum tenue]
MNALPEDCLSLILCFTSPQDACRSSAVSPEFHSVAQSDTVWQNFLPSDYRRIIADSVPALQFSSKKELYRKLCDSVLVDGGRKVGFFYYIFSFFFFLTDSIWVFPNLIFWGFACRG